MRLLIVNDEVISARGLMMGVPWENYGISEVDVAFNAKTAREKLLEKPFDILLCDIEMPGENGMELGRLDPPGGDGDRSDFLNLPR